MKMRSFKCSGLLALILSLSLTWEGFLPLTAHADEIPDTEVCDEIETVIVESEDEIANAVEEPEETDMQASAEESYDTPDTSSDPADMTVMLYSVGSDLEGKSMSATVDILEIMEGLDISGIKDPEVNFIVETGGVNTELKDRSRDTVINERREQIKEEYDKVQAGKGEKYLRRYDLITTGENKIAWNKNERFVIHPDSLELAITQPSDPTRLMTRADDKDVLQELAEFIKTTKTDYPAKQYMLILWNHGGGPLGGLGNDERDEGEDGSTFQAYQIRPTMVEAGITENDKFAMIDYDACLMGSLENMLAWSPYTRYYCGSEDLESNNGDFYENWVSDLCKAADGNKIDFSNESAVNTQMEKTGKTIVEDYYNWYQEKDDIGTKSLTKTCEAAALGTSISNFAKACMDLFEIDPMETYYGVYELRSVSQDFHGREKGIADLRDFVKCMDDEFDQVIDRDSAADPEIKNAVNRMKKAGAEVEKNLGKAVLLHRETSKYSETNSGGLTVFLPYISMGDVKNYFEFFEDIEPSNVLGDYKRFVGVFSAIHVAGELIANGDKGKDDVDKLLQDTLESYGVKDLYKEKMIDVPDEIADHRLQNEGMKIYKDGTDGKIYYKRRDFKLVYSVNQSPKIKIGGADHYLGYFPAGRRDISGDVWRQKLTNYEEKKWFAFKDDNGKYIPVAIYKLDSGFVDKENKEPGDQFAAKTDAMIPVVYDGLLCFLDVGFDEGSQTGKVYGMWPFEYGNRGYGRYIDIESLKEEGEEIKILADVPNALEGDKDAKYDDSERDKSVIGTINLGKSTVLYRGVQLCEGGGESDHLIDNVQSMEMLYFMKDLFGSHYLFDNLTETVNVSLKADSESKPKNHTLNTNDIKLEFKGEKGVYEDSSLKDVKYYYKDEEGNQKELVEKDGKFYTESDEEDVPDAIFDMLGQDAPEVVTAGNLKEFKIERDTEILVLPTDIKIENLEKVDEANIDLDKYFKLNTGALSVTIKAGNTTVKPVSENDQFTDISKPNAKKAMVCDIEPVTYTGRNLLTTQSKSKGSKMIDLVLYSDDGKKILQEGVDYTVSYKNNKNAADKTAGKKAPTLTIAGKGYYNGMKYTAVFTIDKADLSVSNPEDSNLRLNKLFAPLSQKGLSLTSTITLPSGVKVPANQYKLKYYVINDDGSESEITNEELAKMYETSEGRIILLVAAQAIPNADNLVEGSKAENLVVINPKSTGSLSVSFKSNKTSVKDKKPVNDFIKENLKKASLGKNSFESGDIDFLGMYYDSKMTQIVMPNDMEAEEYLIDKAGTFYIGVGLTEQRSKELKNYSVVPIKVNVTDGIKLKKGDVTLERSEYKIDDLQKLTDRIPVTLKFANGFSWDALKVTCSTRNGGTVTKSITADQMSNNTIVLDDIDNGVPGDYVIRIKGDGINTGNLKLTYKVR